MLDSVCPTKERHLTVWDNYYKGSTGKVVVAAEGGPGVTGNT